MFLSCSFVHMAEALENIAKNMTMKHALMFLYEARMLVNFECFERKTMCREELKMPRLCNNVSTKAMTNMIKKKTSTSSNAEEP